MGVNLNTLTVRVMLVDSVCYWFRSEKQLMKKLTRLVEYNLVVVFIYESLLAHTHVNVSGEQLEQMKNGNLNNWAGRVDRKKKIVIHYI